MNKTGKIKETDVTLDFRQFLVNSIGENDIGKYYMLSVFGEDSNIPENTKALTIGSQNKDVNFIVGVLNKLKTDDLNPGDKIIFSTSEDGSEIKSKILLKNTGDIEIEGLTMTLTVDEDINISGSKIALTIDGDADITATGDMNLNADGNVNVTATKLDVNGGNLTVD